jgi:streptogramin lyase
MGLCWDRAAWRVSAYSLLSVVLLGVSGVAVPPAVADPVGQIAEFSKSLSTGVTPLGLAPGPDGQLWFTDPGKREIGEIDPVTGASFGTSNGLIPGGDPERIVQGPDGNMWFTDDGAKGAIGKIAGGGIQAGKITEFPIDPGDKPFGITVGPDRKLWFTYEHGVGNIDPATDKIREIPLFPPPSAPSEITLAADGDMWFTDPGSRTIDRIIVDPSGYTITPFSAGLNPGSSPGAITAGTDGNVWFTDDGATGAIGRVTSTGGIVEFSDGLPTRSSPIGIAAGQDGNVWFTDEGSFAKAIGRIDRQGRIKEFSDALNAGSVPDLMAPGSDGDVWFTDLGTTDAVGRIGTGSAPAFTAPATIVGSKIVGTPQTCDWDPAIWAGVLPSLALYSFDGYRWLRDGRAIRGATGRTYVPLVADAHHSLQCRVTVTYPTPFFVTLHSTSIAARVLRLIVRRVSVDRHTIRVGGRRVNGRCVQPTLGNRDRPLCQRPITLHVTFTLDAATTVTFTVERGSAGRRVDGRCQKATSRNSASPSCTRFVRLKGNITRLEKAGTDRFLFRGTLGGRTIVPRGLLLSGPPIKYQLVIAPMGGVAKTVTFALKR